MNTKIRQKTERKKTTLGLYIVMLAKPMHIHQMIEIITKIIIIIITLI